MSFSEVVSIITVLVVSATLIIYGIQTSELIKQTKTLAQQIAQADASQRAQVSINLNNMMHQLSSALLEHPELRDYIYGDKAVPTDGPLHSQVLTISEMFIDFMATTLDHKDFLPEETHEAWTGYFRKLVDTSPALKSRWEETRGWYESQAHDLLDPVASPREEAPPASGSDVPAASVPRQAGHLGNRATGESRDKGHGRA